MTDATSQFSWAAQPVAGPSAYQLTLAGLALPLWTHYAFNAVGALCILLLGHPWVAAGGFLAACLCDTLFQSLVGRWLAASPTADVDRGFLKLSAACFLRVCVYVGPALVMAASGGPGELAYLGVVAASLLAIAPAAGSLSRRIFWAMAAPVLLGGAGLALTLPPGPAAGVLIGLASVTLMLAMISLGTTKAISAWHAAFNANLALIPELEAARDQALAERTAADAAREEARRATEAKSTFLATMSHEIRTPMNGVLGMAQVLKRDETNPVQAERLATLIDSGEYLLSILNDILDVSKIDAGRLEIVRGVEDLRLFLDRLVGFWGARAGEKRVALGLQVDDDVPDFVMMDALRLRQVLFNLVGNALKFAEGGAVDLLASARPRDGGGVWVRLAVRDTGSGIAAEHLPTLFEPFSQPDELAERKASGTGLGLAIAKQLTELMGGRIWVESEVGVGSTFHVEIPVDLAQAGASPVLREAKDAAPLGLPALRVLAVDDNPVNLLVLEQLLGALGHSIAKAGDGAEALEVLGAQIFDLVLMDIQMPDMSGIEVLARLRSGGGPNRAAPVVALTADVTSGGRLRYLELGFTEHTTKPIQVQDLVETMMRAVASESIRPVARSA
jgi:signal transduction histidine kinase/ActR/RegA family two-component response regulator